MEIRFNPVPAADQPLPPRITTLDEYVSDPWSVPYTYMKEAHILTRFIEQHKVNVLQDYTLDPATAVLVSGDLIVPLDELLITSEAE